MKRIPIIAFVFLILAACTGNEQETDMTKTHDLQPLTDEIVAFYNVQNLFDLENDPRTADDDFTPSGELKWTEERFQEKTKDLAEVLHEIGDKSPLLIGLVEIENEAVVQALANEEYFANTNYKIVHFDSKDARGIDCALLYDADKLVALKEDKLVVRLPNEPNFVTRDILYFKAKTVNESVLHLFVNHWPSRREGKEETEERRLAASLALSNKIKEIKAQEDNANILVMGDFNDEPQDVSLKNLTEIPGSKGSFLTNLMVPLKNNEGGTLVHDREWYLFDQFLVSEQLISGKNLKVKNGVASIYRNEKLLFYFPNGSSKPNATYGGPKYHGGYSDHLPIYLILSQ